MGQRCDLVVIEGGRRERYYSHWAANRLDLELFWGPTQAARFIRAQQDVAADAHWLDEIWAEGGAVLDLDRRALTWYGGEDMVFDVPQRRRYHELAAHPWRRFELSWAHEGVADLADTLGLARATVLNPREPTIEELDVVGEIDACDGDVLITVRSADGLVRWACPTLPQHAIRASEHLLAVARAITRTARATLEELPTSGVHLDLVTREVDAWTAWPSADLPARLANAYPGWTTRWHHDRIEAQLALAGDIVAVPPEDAEATLATIERGLLATYAPVDLAALVTRMHPGRDVEITDPLALRDDVAPLSVADRRAILHDAIAAWRAGRR